MLLGFRCVSVLREDRPHELLGLILSFVVASVALGRGKAPLV